MCICVNILELHLQFMGGRGIKQKIKGVYVHGNVGELILYNNYYSVTYTVVQALEKQC